MVGEEFTRYALKYTDFIFLIVRMVVMDVFFFFFFAKKSTFQGLYNCKLKNEITLILEFFSRKKKKQQQQQNKTKLARWALASLVQSFSLTRFSSPG